MHTRSLHTSNRKFVLWLGVVCALYLALIAGTSVALNHSQLLRLEQRHISRLWLPASYQQDAGYDVPIDVVLRDLNRGLLFSKAGARVLDSLLVLWLLALGVHVGVQIAEHGKAARPTTMARNTTMRQPLQKAAPYGDSGQRATRGKVLQFRR
jgi:hypothetical protein